MNQRNDGSESAPNGDGDHTSPFRPPARKPVLHRVVPVSQELPGYRGGALRRDLLAGITVAALALPSAMAYAELAGLSPVAGLYALLLPTVAYTVLGSCRQLIAGSDIARWGSRLIPGQAGESPRAGEARTSARGPDCPTTDRRRERSHRGATSLCPPRR